MLTAGVAFAVYLATLAPTIGFGDSPELSAAALALGVPHPTGYPLLMLLGYGASQILAFGDPAWRLNWLGALIASGAVGLLAAFVQRLTARPTAGFVAGLTLAFFPAFWANASLFEVYGLHIAFVSGLLWLWLRYEQDPRPRRLRTLAFVAGLASTHHLMIGLILPILAVAVLRHIRRYASFAELGRLALLFALPLCVLAYLPLAALTEPIVNWGDPSSPLRFWSHVTGRQYHDNVATGLGTAWWVDAWAYLQSAVSGLTWPVFALAVFGAATLIARAGPREVHARAPLPSGMRPAALVILAIFTLGLVFGSLYQVVDPEAFFLNADVALAVFVGVGAGAGLDWVGGRRAGAISWVGLGVALLPILPLLAHWSAQDRSDDFAAHDRALAVLEILPPNAILLIQGFEGYPTVYASLIEGVRPDVLVLDHYLRMRGNGGGYGPELERLRYMESYAAGHLVLAVTEVAAGLSRPLFLVPGVPDFEWSRIGLLRVRRGLVDQLIPSGSPRMPVLDAPPPALAVFQNGPVLFSARIGRESIEAGDPTPIELQWAWPADLDPRELSVLVVAGDAQGQMLEGSAGTPVLAHSHPLGQGIPTTGPAAEEWLESIAIEIPRSLEVGPVSLYLALTREGVFQPTTEDRVFVRIGEIEVAPRTRSAWQLPRMDDAPGSPRQPASIARIGSPR